jgi:hypothetical protein
MLPLQAHAVKLGMAGAAMGFRFVLYNHLVEVPKGMWQITEMLGDTGTHAARAVSQPGEG